MKDVMSKIKTAAWMLAMLALVAAQVSAQDEVAESAEAFKELTNAEKLPNGFLIVHKVYSEDQYSVGSRVAVTVEIHNAGQEAAYDITFTDDQIDSTNDIAKLVKGNKKETFNKIEAGDYVSFTQEYETLQAGLWAVPRSTVTYAETEKASTKVVVTSPADAVLIATQREVFMANVWKYGRYVSFGFCKTPGDWVRVGVLAVLVVGLFGGRTTLSKVKSAQDARRRTLARRALGVEELMKES